MACWGYFVSLTVVQNIVFEFCVFVCISEHSLKIFVEIVRSCLPSRRVASRSVVRPVVVVVVVVLCPCVRPVVRAIVRAALRADCKNKRYK